MPDSKRLRILVTGGSGQIASILRRKIGSEFDFVWLTHKEKECSDIVSDLAVPTNTEQLMTELKRTDIVLHLAADADPDAEWSDVRKNNFDAHYNIIELSRKANVKRFIYASSNHAMTGKFMSDKEKPESLVKPHRLISESEPFAPDSLYGLSKVFGENLCWLYSNRHGMECISLRIGWVREGGEEADNPYLYVKDKPEYVHTYMKAMHLSQKDMVEIMKRTFKYKFPDKSGGPKVEVLNVCSNNDDRLFDLSHLEKTLEYTPQDNSAQYFPEKH
eukprot:CAMPEP_0117451346 /NCGR_PEP_ID=MMETSP0759-20121206/8958_1 /TAXON_ID=63605 /ORGANISM="Percolomonas cosmopolitus, Strain WS" /LENGTH=274 /DNA_ID=CAMNT_0005243939 /DNA_START=30 /DNA_END=854 /DNA_ORIENTATION=+